MSNENFGCGVTEADIQNAIEFSGYPLQTQLSNFLREDFFVQEEWSFIDQDTSTTRAMDILAKKIMYDPYAESPFARPTLNLIIECKKSEYPFVFFLSDGKIWTPHFPLVAGLKHETLTITTDDSASTWRIEPLSALGMLDHPFLAAPLHHCMTFSKCTRSGKKVILSGDEPYNSIILPLIKALEHFNKIEKPVKTAVYFDCHLGIPIGVLDAPMVGVTIDGGEKKVSPIPWVRVYRHCTDKNASKHNGQKVLAVDLVQKDFFETYLEQHLLPFAKECSEKTLKHQKVLASGEGFVKSMEKTWGHNIEQDLKPKSTKTTVKRIKAGVTNIIKGTESSADE